MHSFGVGSIFKSIGPLLVQEYFRNRNLDVVNFRKKITKKVTAQLILADGKNVSRQESTTVGSWRPPKCNWGKNRVPGEGKFSPAVSELVYTITPQHNSI